MMVNRTRFWALTAMIAAAAASRLVPHPPNVTPLTAIALLGGATFASRSAAALVPLAALLTSDLVLGLTHALGWQPVAGFYAGQWVVYACFLAVVGIGFLLRGRATLPRAAAASLAGSVLFFLATNLVWVYGPDSLYPRNLQGLLTSYTAALPFFRNSLAGDLAFTLTLFGTLSWAESRFPSLRRSETVPAAA